MEWWLISVPFCWMLLIILYFPFRFVYCRPTFLLRSIRFFSDKFAVSRGVSFRLDLTSSWSVVFRRSASSSPVRSSKSKRQVEWKFTTNCRPTEEISRNPLSCSHVARSRARLSLSFLFSKEEGNFESRLKLWVTLIRFPNSCSLRAKLEYLF